MIKLVESVINISGQNKTYKFYNVITWHNLRSFMCICSYFAMLNDIITPVDFVFS